jgi:hypothetical protein
MAEAVSGLSTYAHARDCLTVLQTNKRQSGPKKLTSVECGVPPAEGGQPNVQAVADIEQLAG